MTQPTITSDKGGVNIQDAGGTSVYAPYANKDLGTNFQHYTNPTTGKTIGLGKDKSSLYGQALSDQGYVIGGFPKPNESELVDSIVNNNTASVTQGTDTTRDVRNEELTTLANQLKISGQAISGGTTSDTERAEIEQARENARIATQGMVDAQVESRRQTLPSEIVRAGQRGGFESTQQSGVAALQGTKGAEGEAFVGAGGKLDETKQTLDKAVIAAKLAQQQAMNEAEAAARTAIQTRRKDDYAIAKDMYTIANDASKYADEVDRDKRNFDQDVKQYEEQNKRAIAAEERAVAAEERETTKFVQENEDRISGSAASALVSLSKDFEVISPSDEEIAKAAEQLNVSPLVLKQEVNNRIEEIQGTAREERASKLNELKFNEQKEQNKISNDLQRRQLSISAGNLAISQARLALDSVKETVSPGIKGEIEKLPVGQQDGAYSAIASFKNAKDILELLDAGVSTGPLAGRSLTGITGPFGIPLSPGKQALGESTEKENQLLAAMTAFSANFIKGISGAQVSDREYERLMNSLPGINRQEDVNRDSIKSLLDTITNKYETQLGVGLQQYRTGSNEVYIQGKNVTVGSTIQNSSGQKGRVNADGTITIIK